VHEYRYGLIGLLAFLPALTGGSPAAQPPPGDPSETCEIVQSCIESLIAQVQAGRQVSEPVRLRLATLGDSAVDALVPLMSHPNPRIRDSAGLALSYFQRVDPRHLPALVRAWRDGSGWMPRPIGATGTDEALRLLWQDFVREARPHAQVVFALARMEERVRPLLIERFRDCRESSTGEECLGIYALLHDLEPPYPNWSVDPIVDIALNARSDEARQEAEAHLVRLRHPAGLAPSQRRLADLSAERALEFDGRWDATTLIDQVSSYGSAARSSGPAIARFLAPAFDEDLRADAALALGEVGDATAVPALLALAPELHDDWLLAYHVAESLGRLRAAEARPVLEDLARRHWHKAVRNNAARALHSIETGHFVRPEVPGDGQPYPPPRGEDGEEYLYFGGLRFAGDDQPRWCSGADTGQSQRLAQDPVGTMRWPRRGRADLILIGLDEVRQQEVRHLIPMQQVRGSVIAVLPVRAGQLIAFNGGEFGGGVYHVRENQAAQPLLDEPVFAAWLMGGRLYVAAGLAHLVLDRGHLYVIDPAGLTVERIVRLPASPRGLAVSSHRAVIVKTNAGDLAVRANGEIVDPTRIGDCAND
jgi:HEAT repeat protein